VKFLISANYFGSGKIYFARQFERHVSDRFGSVAAELEQFARSTIVVADVQQRESIANCKCANRLGGMQNPQRIYFTPFSGFHEPCSLRTKMIWPMW
jgi:hypothetical protein